MMIKSYKGTLTVGQASVGSLVVCVRSPDLVFLTQLQKINGMWPRPWQKYRIRSNSDIGILLVGIHNNKISLPGLLFDEPRFLHALFDLAV